MEGVRECSYVDALHVVTWRTSPGASARAGLRHEMTTRLRAAPAFSHTDYYKLAEAWLRASRSSTLESEGDLADHPSSESPSPATATSVASACSLGGVLLFGARMAWEGTRTRGRVERTDADTQHAHTSTHDCMHGGGRKEIGGRRGAVLQSAR